MRSRGRVAVALVATAMVVLGGSLASGASLQQTVTAADGVADDRFGTSVAIDGDTAVVGMPESGGGNGAVYVYTRSADSWAFSAKLTATDGALGDRLGESVAIDGDTIVAGAPGDNNPDDNEGSAYTFARAGLNPRTQTAKLTASDGDDEIELGGSVAIHGDTIVAGANAWSDDKGAIYTFDRSGTNRTENARLTATDGADFDALGTSVAIRGETVVAGAPGDDFTTPTTTDQGSVYTFANLDTGPFNETAKLTATDGISADRLGTSVAIHGDTIVAGTLKDDTGPAPSLGAAYTFATSGVNPRTETAKLTTSDAYAGDLSAVAIDLDTIVAGAPGDDSTTTDQGSVYTYARSGVTPRNETGKLIASGGATGDLLGSSVAIDGDQIVAGAPLDTVGANAAQGSATFFFDPVPVVEPPGPGPEPTPVPPTPDTTAPHVELTAKTPQQVGKSIKVEVECDEACTVDLSGSVKPKGEKKGELKPKSLQLAAGATAKTKLKLGEIKAALKAAGKGKAKVSATATDAAGNASGDVKAKVKLEQV